MHSPSPDTPLPILIIGAGPTGLMLACQLAMRGVAFRIIDRTDDHTTQSRALAVHARSMEIFEQMGISDRFLAQGEIVDGAEMIFNGKPQFMLNMKGFDPSLTRYPYVLIHEQYKTEVTLLDFLKRYDTSVERLTELISLTPNEQAVSCVLKNANGHVETVRASYVVGCDGARSAVRDAMGVGFGGTTYDVSLFVLDCKAQTDFSDHRVHGCLTEHSAFTLFFPMKDGMMRVIGTVPDGLVEELTFSHIADTIRERTERNISLSDPKWMSVYHTHHRYASSFRAGRCFLAGDAAHIHSPIGGQGMNTGLQDAYNLAWKLALVVQGKGHEALLDSYSPERIAVARGLVRSTDRAFFFMINRGAFGRWLRLKLAPRILHLLFPIVQNSVLMRMRFFKILSEIGLHYRYSLLNRHASCGHFPKDAPKPGDRAPFVSHSHLQGTQFHLFFFNGNTHYAEFSAILQVVNQYRDTIEIETLPMSPQNKPLYQAFGIEKTGLILIRPDGYIAYRATTPDGQHFRRCLEQYLL